MQNWLLNLGRVLLWFLVSHTTHTKLHHTHILCIQRERERERERVKPSSQYDASRCKAPHAMQRHAKICQHGDITLCGISSYCDKSYDVAQNRKSLF